MKRKLTAVLAAIMVMSACPTYAATLKIDGMYPLESMKNSTEDGVEMISADVLFDLVGAKHSFNKYTKVYTAEKNDVSIVIDTKTGTVTGTRPDENGETVTKAVELPKQPYCEETTVDDVTKTEVYVPLKVIGEYFGLTVKWNTDTNSIDISKNNENGYIMLSTSSDEIDSDTKVLTYDEALELAKKRSSDLKSLDDSVYYLDSLRSDLGDSIFQINQYEQVIGNQIVAIDKALDTADDTTTPTLRDQLVSAEQSMQSNMESFVTVARNIKKVELQQSMNDVNKEMIEDGLELTLMNYITQIRNTETQLSLLEESVALGQENIRNLEVKNQLGYESDTALASAKTTQSESESSLKELKLTLENAKQDLKTFLGLKADDNVYIKYDPEDNTFFENLALEPYITKKTNGDPSIRTLKNNVLMNEYIVRTNVVYQSENKKGVQNDLATAQRALKDAQDSMEKSIRKNYNTILQLKEMSKTYNKAITQAVADYNTALVSYESGFATEYQVKQAKLAVINAEKKLDDNELNIAMLEFQLEHPYLLS
jgi:hypothetical protein